MASFDFGALANSLGNAVQEIGTYSAQATARANAISAQAQSAQGAFNQASANQANGIDNGRLASQYGFNSAMMNAANQYNTQAWNTAAAWNEEMWQRQADFNAAEAQKQRDWQEYMSNTQYQRSMADMEKAGLNPILAAGGSGAGVPGGAAASVGGAQMSSASAQMASGGLLGANSASEGNYTGIAESMGTTLALLGAIFGGISSAYKASGTLGDSGAQIMSEVVDNITESTDKYSAVDWGEAAGKWTQEKLKDAGKWIVNKITGEKEHHVNKKTYDNLNRTYQRLENDRRKGNYGPSHG